MFDRGAQSFVTASLGRSIAFPSQVQLSVGRSVIAVGLWHPTSISMTSRYQRYGTIKGDPQSYLCDGFSLLCGGDIDLRARPESC
jgi:hypothetical protein